MECWVVETMNAIDYSFVLIDCMSILSLLKKLQVHLQNKTLSSTNADALHFLSYGFGSSESSKNQMDHRGYKFLCCSRINSGRARKKLNHQNMITSG